MGLWISTSFPSTVMVPASFEYAPIKILIRVDFPAPFSPTNPWTSPALTLKLTPFRALHPGEALVDVRHGDDGCAGLFCHAVDSG